MTVYSFEAEILDSIQTNRVSFNFDESRHVMQSESLSIQFIPNLSAQDYSKFNKALNSDVISVWEDVYRQNRLIVKSIIQSRLGLNKRVYARQTSVEPISQAVLNDFLEENHLLGKAKCKYRLGLLYEGKMLAVIAFGRSCPIQYKGDTFRSHELIRFCSKKGITIVGGLTKLLSHFVRQQNPEHIMTYVDKEWSNGDNFSKIGFELIGETNPETFWVALADGKRYRTHEQTTNTNFEKGSWQEVRNSGNYKFVKLYK